ncbi:hypothetical protein BC940DRAFT_337616 [Gongronella butleri]|nr:hypothetical protein BC940DRAFT_337616 [Gongronella butleri]
MNHGPSSPLPCALSSTRTFEPIILFHDHCYVKDGARHMQHVAYGDPHYHSMIQQRKRQMRQTLDMNGRLWTDRLHDDSAGPTSAWPPSSPSTPPMPHMEISSSSSPSSMRSMPTMPSPPPIPALPSFSEAFDASKSRATTRHHGFMAPNSHDSSYSPHPYHSPAPPAAPHPQHTYHHHHHHHHHHLTPSSPPRRGSNSTSTPLPSSNGGTKMFQRRRRGNLPKHTTNMLRQWLMDHKQHPYPTEDEKLWLAEKTNLTVNQISNWFINARRRILIQAPQAPASPPQPPQQHYLPYGMFAS